jgi:DNA-binding CsgD family transcriptional regulator
MQHKMLVKPREYQVTNYGLLSPLQEKILPLIAEGLTNKEIARAFDISPNTVKKRVFDIMYKLNAINRTHIITQAFTHSVIKVVCLCLTISAVYPEIDTQQRNRINSTIKTVRLNSRNLDRA